MVEPLCRLPRAFGRVTQEAEEEEGRVDSESSPPAKGLSVGAAEEIEIFEVRLTPQAVPSAGAHDGAHDFFVNTCGLRPSRRRGPRTG